MDNKLPPLTKEQKDIGVQDVIGICGKVHRILAIGEVIYPFNCFCNKNKEVLVEKKTEAT